MSPGPQEHWRSPSKTAADAFFSTHHRQAQQIWSAPGRINLIGEHTDYNGGYVLPFALLHRLAVAAAPREDETLTLTTVGTDGELRHAEPVLLSQLRPGRPCGWAAYPAGVAWVLRQHGLDQGADLVLAGNIPVGAGLASSAAVECATALTLLGIAGHGEPDPARRVEIARWGQRVENEFLGVPTGVLDQTASMCCVADHALFFDTRSGAREQVPLDLARAGLDMLVIDTRVEHSHAESGYADRRHETARAATLLELDSLGELTTDRLPSALRELPSELQPLVRHVVTENARVLRTVDHLREGHVDAIGPLLDASHASLRDDYRVSCPELDLAVTTAREAGGLGARMTGGGFGGSAIVLLRKPDRQHIEETVRHAFRRSGFRPPRMFPTAPSPGAGRETTR